MSLQALIFFMMMGVVVPSPEEVYVAPAAAAAFVPHLQPVYEDPIPYEFAYGVKDDYTGADFGHSEHSDGKNIYGSYTVQLPDGRRQTVKYVADDYKGYIAEVTYIGEAQYPKEYGPPITFRPAVYDNHLGYQ